ncbi:MAG: TIGR01620 family protein [Rhodobacteraceae bacterium]|nr:TIGR01620 family protein [Paracoccaceae bacterium]
MSDTGRRRPVIVDLEPGASPRPGPADAPPIEDAPGPPQGVAMQELARRMSRPPSRLARWFWRLGGALLALLLGLWAWDALTALLSRSALLGGAALLLLGAFLLICVLMALREWLALTRLARIDGLRSAAEAAVLSGDLEAARAVTARLLRLYADRPETAWGRGRLAERAGEMLDAEGELALAETELLAPLDAAARAEVEAAARKVAAVTALVPIALADVAAALVSNLSMIRRIGEIYGGRGGALGAWRLTRAVMGHLVATGAVAVGDDMLEPILGGGLASRLSRRFGEGVVNGALTARVGVAAIEVCRPLPFVAAPRPRASALVRGALAGLMRRG